MTEFGLLITGLKVKRLEDVRADLEAQLRAAFGAGLVLTPDTKLGKLVGAVAEQAAEQWELAEAIYDAQYPNTASDVSLDRVAQITAISRRAATRSTVTLYLGGTPSTNVPAGSLVAVVDAGDQFRTLADVTLGPVGNVSVVQITRSGSTATVEATGHGLVVDQRVWINGADQPEYNGLQQVDTVPDPDHFTYEVSGTPATPATGTITLDGATAAEAESVETGPIQALAGTLTEIVNSVTGWSRVENQNDATLGLDVETDDEFRTRRIDALQGLGAARLEAIRGALLGVTGVVSAKVFENDTDGTDVAGRPPHTIEALVVGGADQDLLDTVWDKKAGGIATHGTVSGTVTDSQGIDHTVKFSRPTEIDIWLEVDLTVDSDFPADGTTQVENRLLAFGDALEIGEDVVVFPYLLASFDDVPGITDVVVRIVGVPDGNPDPGPTSDDNVTIQETEIAIFDSARITVATV